MASKTYNVKLTLVINEDASHPRKWLSETIWANLNCGEDITDIEFEEVEEKVDGSSTN